MPKKSLYHYYEDRVKALSMAMMGCEVVEI